jgi:drug/metabolite transporter (DMT)-like permease
MIRPEFIFGPGDNNDNDKRQYAALICLVVSLLLSLNGIFIKLTGKSVHPITLVLFGVLFSSFLAPIACLIFEGFTGPGWTEVLQIFLMALFNFFGQFFLTKSYQLSEKTIGITLANYIQMFFAYLFDMIVIGYKPEVYSLIGSILIIISCLYILIKMRK